MQEPVKAMIVEDDPFYADQLEFMIQEMGHEVVGICADGPAAMELYAQTRPNLVLMDIDIKGDMDGIEVTAALHEIAPARVIYITSHIDEASYARAKATAPAAFLEKSFRKRQLQRAIDVVLQQSLDIGALPRSHSPETEAESVQAGQNGRLLVRGTKTFEHINIADIGFLKVEDHYCYIHTANGRFISRSSFADILAELPEADFVRTHRSYAVNLNHVKTIHIADQTVQVFDEEIPIGRSYKDHILNRFKRL